MNYKGRHDESLQMAAEYESGDSLRVLAAKYGMSVEGVRYRLRSYGVTLRKRGGDNRGKR